MARKGRRGKGRNDPDQIGGRSNYRHPVEEERFAREQDEAIRKRERQIELEDRVGRKLRERLARRGITPPRPPLG